MRTVLVANRGEIAVRVIGACRELGLRTVAVYADPDRDALYPRLADDRVPLGASDPLDTYLHVGRLLDAARRSGADTVHPGYGFLAESAEFAAAVREAGLVWVGPPADVIARVGDKTEARRLARRAGVPVVAGCDAEETSDADLTAAAGRIGFPLMIKAAAGGGGRGMRRVNEASDLPGALASARREARAAFGRDALLLERHLDEVHHVEVQVLADATGVAMALGERECSVQRRHQKLIEESPSPFVTAELRSQLERAAVAIAETAGYVNAGTVEFLVDADRRWYFLEVNARLQVEHPVTEMVTGVDLVKAQLHLAAGDRLPADGSGRSRAPRARGHAIECRVCAEDAAHGFRPTPGPILALVEPHGPGVRVDSGLRAGWRVPVEYDPMLAKVIAHAATREDAATRMADALGRYVILGCQTNLEFLRAVVRHDAFRDGETTTRFLERHFGAWTGEADGLAAAAAAVLTQVRDAGTAEATAAPGEGGSPAGSPGRDWDPWLRVGPWRMGMSGPPGAHE
ncbi:MAG TPA: biotin carboxylase N-terminal domain-containing protein [bacterium]|nr:biotin carboxylase N-terminal domain-containing protein [bacterium]